MKKFLNLLSRHKLALVFALIVGLIYVLPNVIFVKSLGADYRGIPLMGTNAEDFYLARIQEIIDGHPAVGSSAFYEYKDRPALSPPVAEFFYALPARLTGLTPVEILPLSRFSLPVILFLLIYALLYGLAERRDFSAKLNAVAGSLFVLLGYNLIDYRSVWSFFASGLPLSFFGRFLLWARPVNPVMGGIFLFGFLVCLSAIARKSEFKRTAVIGAAVFLALAMGNYFFSWGMGLAVWFALTLIYLIKKEFSTVKKLALVFPGALVLSSPYWYFSWRASLNPQYAESVFRDGLFLTHYPLLNVLMMAVLAAYLIALAWPIIRRWPAAASKRELLKSELAGVKDWQWFSLAIIFGALIAYSQQIVTGMTIWPFHFAQYSIPLAIVALVLLLYHLVSQKWPKIWRAAAVVLIGFLLVWGITNQAAVYKNYYDYFRGQQAYGPVFNWLNNQPKDSVVLMVENDRESSLLNGLIPAFTHSNTYSSSWIFSILPQERILHNYLVMLRLRGVSSSNIEEYLKRDKNENNEASGYLFSNWKGAYGVMQFPDFSDDLLPVRLKQLPADYREFLKKDFRAELSRYRLDYIMSLGPLEENLKKDLPGLKPAFTSGNVNIYEF